MWGEISSRLTPRFLWSLLASAVCRVPVPPSVARFLRTTDLEPGTETPTSKLRDSTEASFLPLIQPGGLVVAVYNAPAGFGDEYPQFGRIINDVVKLLVMGATETAKVPNRPVDPARPAIPPFRAA